MPRRRGTHLFLSLICVGSLIIASFGPAVRAQDTPFVSDRTWQLLNGELSGDLAFETIRILSQYHKASNSPGYTATARYLLERAREFGLEEAVILMQSENSLNWQATEASIWLTEPALWKIADLNEAQLMLADYSRSADLETELVFVGEGTNRDDYAGVDVSGKVVFATGSPSTVTRLAVFERGAAGIVTAAQRSDDRSWDYPDQIPWQRIPSAAPEGFNGTWFGFNLPPRRGFELQNLLEGNALPPEVGFTGVRPEGPFTVRVRVRADVDEGDTETEFMEARIRGTDPNLPAIVFMAHIQEEKYSANDDLSGCANVLEIGRAIKKLVDTGMIDRPRRTLRFWNADEISGPYQYFRDNPGERDAILVAFNQDMVGAKQSVGDRFQHIIRSPHHQASYLADVVESVAEAVIRGNTAFLAARAAGAASPFPRPIFSRLGTREPYSATIVPNFNNSDQMVFNEGIIGIPCVGFINWPDQFIHSTGDDLWQIDPTQMKRNAFIIAASALYLANAGPTEVPTLVAEVQGRGSERLGLDLRTAMQLLAAAPDRERVEAWRQGSWIIEAGGLREARALRTITDFMEGDAAVGEVIDTAVSRSDAAVAGNRETFDRYYRTVTGAAPGRLRLTPAESAAAGMVPVNVDDVDRYLGARPRIGTGLHSLMTFAVWGHVDGATSVLDIYKQVMAEAAVHGAWYYGTVSLEQVVETIEAGIEAGILILR
ncbi:M28 family peptidase [Gemmatimonadota bacterium]